MNNKVLAAVDQPKTLKTQALEQIRNAITLGHFQPDQRLVERALCADLQVSRTVIRECIRHLESEKLVVVQPNIGPRVASLSHHEVEEIYKIRCFLESEAIARCAERSNSEMVSLLKSDCASIAKDLSEQDFLSALNQTRTFYGRIFDLAGNRVAWGLVEQLNARIARLRMLTLSSPGRAEAGPSSLKRIVDAIERSDAGEAAQACQDHLQQACQIALKRL